MKKLKTKEPSKLALLLTAVSGVSLGILAAGYLLLMKPVVPMSGKIDEKLLAQPGNYDTYYIKGGTAVGETPNLRNGVGRIQRRTVGPVSFSEHEINYFFGQFKNTAEASSEEGPPPSSVEQFNVRISGDRMIASFKLIMDPKGENRFEMLVKGNVTFENTETGPRPVFSNVRVNSLPVPGFGGLLSSFVTSAVEGMEMPQEFVEMWSNIRRIELASGKLIVDVGLRRPPAG